MLAVITEFMASNQSTELVDEDGEHSDWIEIHNPAAEPIDLTGWHLTDSPGRLTRWTFPSVTLAAGEYLVVFASGKNRTAADMALHTNFKLDRDGEYLALVQPDGVTVRSQYGTATEDYPSQFADVSYGATTSLTNGERGLFYMPQPTPGAANEPGVIGFLGDTRFDVDRGFYTASDLLPGGALAQGVTITATAPEAAIVRIYYTTDGSAPAPGNPAAFLYTQPVSIRTTTTLRAAAFADGYLPTNIDTHTYLFVDDVLRQDGAGLPPLTGTDYAMDPEIVQDPRFVSLPQDLRSLPTVSFVGSVDDLFGPDGILENPTGLGDAWEREVSVELLYPDGSDGFQENAGLRIQGAGSRDRPFSKKGFQLFFRGEYGAGQLEFPFFGPERASQIDRLAFRGNFFDSWTFNNPGQIGAACCGYNQALLLRDQFGHETHEAMGALAIAGNWVHLYLNGQYWGLYNAIERPDEHFAASYLGGSPDDYDVLKQRPRGQANGSPPEVVYGDRAAWNQLMQLVKQDIQDDAIYQQIAEVLDLEQFADYVLLNIFGGNFDWPHNNWYALRQRVDGSKWRFVSWDTENFIFDVNADRTDFNTDNSPGIIYDRLRRNADFQLLFADRVHRHLFNDGALTPANNIERFTAIADQIRAGMNAESARWGDTHAAVPRNTIDHWQPVVDEKVNQYFPRRTAIVLSQLMADSLYPPVEAPEYLVDGRLQHGGEVLPEASVGMVQPSGAFVDTALIGADAQVTAYIPGVDEFAEPTWTALDFDPATDPHWSSALINGAMGIGFDGSGNYDAWIHTNVAQMEDRSSSILTRIPFTYDGSTVYDRLQLQARYDDGFVAYLNGAEVARSDNIRRQLPPQNAQARSHTAREAFEVFDLSQHRNLLREGTNILAVQVINVSAGSNDLLMDLRLFGGILDLTEINQNIWYTTDGSDPRDAQTGQPSATATQLTAPLEMASGMTVRARAFENGQWSALSETHFSLVGDFNQDGILHAADVDLLAQAIRDGRAEYDLTGDAVVDFVDLRFLVENVLRTHFGDANLSGQFDSSDLVQVFQFGEYEDDVPGNSTWGEGDWNGDGEFTTGDLVLAFESGGFVAASRQASRLRISADIAAAIASERMLTVLDNGSSDTESRQTTMDQHTRARQLLQNVQRKTLTFLSEYRRAE